VGPKKMISRGTFARPVWENTGKGSELQIWKKKKEEGLGTRRDVMLGKEVQKTLGGEGGRIVPSKERRRGGLGVGEELDQQRSFLL